MAWVEMELIGWCEWWRRLLVPFAQICANGWLLVLLELGYLPLLRRRLQQLPHLQRHHGPLAWEAYQGRRNGAPWR